VTSSAPRYDARLIGSIRRLDDEALPIAEVCRRVAAHAERLGLARPSYVHVRRIVRSERERAAEMKQLRNAALLGAVTRMIPDPTELAVRYTDVKEGDRLRLGRNPRSPLCQCRVRQSW